MSRPKANIPLPARMVPDPGPQGIISPNLTDSGALPRLDTQAALAPAQGMGDIGVGMQKAGGAIMALAEKKKEADAIVAERKATLLMKEANADIAAQVAAEADQTKWADIESSRMDQLAGELGELNVDPDTKAMIDFKYASNRVDVAGGLKIGAAKQSFAEAQRAITDTVEDAALQEDDALAEHTIAGAVEKKMISPEQGNLLRHGYKQKVAQQQEVREKEQFLGAVMADPEKALEIAKDPRHKTTNEVRAWKINAAQQGIREQSAAAADAAQNEIAKGLGGQLATEEAVDKWAAKQPGMDAHMIQATKDAVNRRNSAKHKMYIAQNAPELASILDTEISTFDRDDASAKVDYFDLRQRIGDLPEDVATPLRTKLDAIMKGTTLPADHTLQGTGRQATQSMFDQGLFGTWWTNEPVTIIDAEGNDTGRQVKDANGKPKTKKVVNEAAWRTAVFQRSELDGAYTRYLQANPNATPAQAEAFLNMQRPKSMIAGLWDQVTGQHLPPTDETYKPKGKRSAAPKATPVEEPAPAEPPAVTGEEGPGTTADIPEVPGDSLFPTGSPSQLIGMADSLLADTPFPDGALAPVEGDIPDKPLLPDRKKKR